jgi:hypothetical protein
VSSPPTTESIKIPQALSRASTGDWTEDKEDVGTFPMGLSWRALAGGGQGCIRASSVSSGTDPWFEYSLNITPLTSPYLTPIHRRRIITTKEARLLALQILQEAEEERCRFADYEAQRGIHWEEEA